MSEKIIFREEISRCELDSKSPSEKATKIKEFLLMYLKGQDDAVKDIVDAIEIHEAGFQEPDKPIYKALFSGPSGVGKTFLAELLAEYFHGRRDAFTRIACEDYSQSHEVARLYGSPPGYAAHWNPNDPRDSGTEPILSQGMIDSRSSQRSGQAERIRRKIREIEKQIGENKEFCFATVWWIFEGMKSVKKPDDITEEQFVEKQKKERLEQEKIVVDLIQKNRTMEAQIGRLEAQFQALIPKNPISIILFDEIEKAHPALFNVLLNIMDKAELQMGNGQITSFKNSIIIMTTNAGARSMAEELYGEKKKKIIGLNAGDRAEKIEKKDLDQNIYKVVIKALKEIFPPEFLGRLDRISVFRPLSEETMREIFDMELARFLKLFLTPRGIKLTVSSEVKDFVIKEATDNPALGARLLKGKISKYLKKQICRIVNRGDIEGGDIIFLELHNEEEIVFVRERAFLAMPELLKPRPKEDLDKKT